MSKSIDLTGKRFGRLVVIEKLNERKRNRVVWRCKCDCGNYKNVVSTDLTTGETRSCGCLKADQNEVNLREEYENKRVKGIAKHLFKDKEPRKDSSTGYRGVTKYYTRKSKELRYRAWITVKGHSYYKSGFKTPEEAYYNGRLELEKIYLPQQEDKEE